jgi:hypothetical protein
VLAAWISWEDWERVTGILSMPTLEACDQSILAAAAWPHPRESPLDFTQQLWMDKDDKNDYPNQRKAYRPSGYLVLVLYSIDSVI